jgi:hypothetical protein
MKEWTLQWYAIVSADVPLFVNERVKTNPLDWMPESKDGEVPSSVTECVPDHVHWIESPDAISIGVGL